MRVSLWYAVVISSPAGWTVRGGQVREGQGADVTELGLTRWVHGGAWLTEQIRRATALVGAPSPSGLQRCSAEMEEGRRSLYPDFW